jgi:hypothetical protein
MNVAGWQEIIKLSKKLPCNGDLKPESHRKNKMINSSQDFVTYRAKQGKHYQTAGVGQVLPEN